MRSALASLKPHHRGEPDSREQILPVKTKIGKSEANQKRRRLPELLARVHPSYLEVEVAI
jgi:hypothetical protein